MIYPVNISNQKLSPLHLPNIFPFLLDWYFMYLYTIYKKFLILIKVKKYSISTSFTHFLTKNPVGTRVCWGNQRTKNTCCHACRNASFSEKITKFAIAIAVLTLWDSVKKVHYMVVAITTYCVVEIQTDWINYNFYFPLAQKIPTIPGENPYLILWKKRENFQLPIVALLKKGPLLALLFSC